MTRDFAMQIWDPVQVILTVCIMQNKSKQERMGQNFYDLVVQKYTFNPETHKMVIVLGYEVYNFMFHTTRIGHENTYAMHET